MADLDRAARILEELRSPPLEPVAVHDVCTLLEALGCEYEDEGIVRVYAHPNDPGLTFSVHLGYPSLPVTHWQRLEALASGFLEQEAS